MRLTCIFLFIPRCGVPQCVCISISMLSADQCSAGYQSDYFHFQHISASSSIAGPVNNYTLPTLNLASAVSTLASLSKKEKAEVSRALETSSVEFSRMEDTFNQKRFKRKWVQSTPESSSMGQKTRLTDNLVDTTSKSKEIKFESTSMHTFQPYLR